MPRDVPANLAQLLPNAVAHSTVEIRMNDGLFRRIATDEITIGGNLFTADLRNVGEIVQSRGKASDRVSLTAQNTDKSFGLEILSDFRRLDFAETIVGRYLYKASNPALNAWVELFRGKLVNAGANDTEANFSIVDSLTAAGFCISIRKLLEDCQFVYKDPKTCGYVGNRPQCNHLLNSRGGCSGRENTHRYGGWKHPKPPASSYPGSGGNGGDGGGTCFTGETLISMADGSLKRIDQIEAGDFVLSFDAISRQRKGKIVRRVFHHFAPNYYTLNFGDYSINTTPDHRFFTQNGWLAADYFRLNQEVIRVENFRDTNRRLERLTQSRWHSYEPTSVYNFEVADFHSYFANGFAVSNSKLPIDRDIPY